MTAEQQFLTASSPEFEVLPQPRPDGGLLLTLRNDDRVLVKRALYKGQTQTRMQLEWVVSSVRRDLALEAVMSPSIEHLQSQSRTALPTYEYELGRAHVCTPVTNEHLVCRRMLDKNTNNTILITIAYDEVV